MKIGLGAGHIGMRFLSEEVVLITALILRDAGGPSGASFSSGFHFDKIISATRFPQC